MKTINILLGLGIIVLVSCNTSTEEFSLYGTWTITKISEDGEVTATEQDGFYMVISEDSLAFFAGDYFDKYKYSSNQNQIEFINGDKKVSGVMTFSSDTTLKLEYKNPNQSNEELELLFFNKNLLSMEQIKSIQNKTKKEKRQSNSVRSLESPKLKIVPENEYVWENISTTLHQMALAKTGTIDDYSETQKSIFIRNLIECGLKKHGYSYTRTLHSYANRDLNFKTGQYAIVLVLPVQGNTSDNFINSIFKGQERTDVKKIIKKLYEIGMPI